MKRRLFLLLPAGLLLGILLAVLLFWRQGSSSLRSARVLAWLRDPGAHLDWSVQAGQRCGSAPLLLPTSGLIGYLWDDSFRPGHRHTGLDIFGGAEPGVVPVVAATDGYLTREASWKSAVILRLPSDPLNPGREIWLYYAHMADPEGNSFIAPQFPPGTREQPVAAGTLLGYQGNYSGSPANPVGVHLHFSIVLSDGQGGYRSELEIANTLDPSPYLGLPLNGPANPEFIPVCPPTS